MAEDLLSVKPVYSKLFIFLFLFSLSSCANVGYVVTQGIEQFRIQIKGIKNKKVLEDPEVSDDIKNKIRIIGVYKDYFENYFQKEFEDIYEKTTFLDRDAVSYMVTASSAFEIKPYYVSFPFVGRFPYLAFFKKDKAIKHAKKLEKEGYVTWIRPVYAYSSLNYFDDRILSSFFVYSETELAELVFHELTHLLVFIKNDVGFNESLAQYIAHQVLKEYFPKKGSEFLIKREKSRQLAKQLVPEIEKLNQSYKKVKEIEKVEELRIKFLEEVLFVKMREYCRETNTQCRLKVENWNNARLVGYLNYEGTYEKIEKVHKASGLNLNNFAEWITQIQEDYDEDDHGRFIDYLELQGQKI